MAKTKTIDLKGKEYAQVKDRLKEFRQANPNGLIETKPTVNPDGTILFAARVLADKSNPTSAEATGHAFGQTKGEKAFEKLETIAVGRALAMLGYSSDGDIASSEEMQDFLEYKQREHDNRVVQMKERLEKATSLDELKTIWPSIPPELKVELKPLLEELKVKYANK